MANMIKTPETGLFLILEGGEGAGKSTLINHLKTAFKKQNVPVTVFREPGGTPFSEDIRETFFNYDNLSTETSTHLMNAQRRDNIEKIVIPALENNHVVIADRFTASSLVYQGILHNKYDTVNQLMIDIDAFTVFVDVPPEVGLKRINDNKRETNHFDRMTLDKHQRIYDGFLSLSQRKPDVYWDLIINGQADMDTLELLMKHFANVITDERHAGYDTRTLKSLFRINRNNPRYSGNLPILPNYQQTR